MLTTKGQNCYNELLKKTVGRPSALFLKQCRFQRACKLFSAMYYNDEKM